MVLNIQDWCFQVEPEETFARTTQNSKDHCTCGYCKNFYETVPMAYPEVISFLDQFGAEFHGPSEVMPFLPTYILACYRISGKILKFGRTGLSADQIPITPEYADETSFYLWVGEMALPWIQDEPEEDVISPANLPEFMDRMEEIWLLRHGSDSIQS